MKTLNHFGKVADHLFNIAGLKVENAYIEEGNYSDYAVYINRIGAYNKPKFRVLRKGTDKVKNCIKITYDPNKWERKDLVKLIESKSKLLTYNAVGTCQQYLRHSIIKAVLVLNDNSNRPTAQARQLLGSTIE